MGKVSQFIKSRSFQGVLGMILGAVIYSAGVVFILDLGNFYAGGITGISQIIQTIFSKGALHLFPGFKSIFVAVMNVPLFLIGWRGVSKRFAVLSLLAVIIQTVTMALFELLQDYGFNPLQELQSDKLTLAILGGLVLGLGNGICLKSGASTGGMDIINQFLSFKKKTSFTKISFSIDFCIIVTGGLVGDIKVAIYTIVRLICSILVMDKVYTIYKYVKLSIVTEEKNRMRDALVNKFVHGLTIYAATGGYSNTPKYVFETVILTYEIADYRDIVHQIDPNCFVTYTAIKSIDGHYTRKTIS